jgi:hypothetical protein
MNFINKDNADKTIKTGDLVSYASDMSKLYLVVYDANIWYLVDLDGIVCDRLTNYETLVKYYNLVAKNDYLELSVKSK